MPITNVSFVGILSILLAMIFQLLIFSWNGNELSIASEEIANVVYDIDWIMANNSTKRLIILIMQRAQKPVYITLGKFANLSMTTFVMVQKIISF